MTQEIMDQPEALSSSEQTDLHQGTPHQNLHSPMRPKHAHSMTHRSRNLKRKREVAQSSQGYAALDVVVVDQGTTVGDVLLASIPSDPTTASLPGYGLLTLSSFIPAAATDSSSSALTTPAAAPAARTGSTGASSPAPTAAASASSLTPAMTGSNSTSAPSMRTNSTATSIAFNIGMATSLNASTSTTSLSTSFSSSDTLTSSTVSTSFATTTSSQISSSSASTNGGGIIGGGAGVPTSNVPGSSPTTGASSGSTTNAQAGPIAGGVVGGVAGAALLAALIFILIRLYRKRQARGDRLIGGPDEEHTAQSGTAGSPPMTQRSSLAPLAAAVRRFRPDSTQTSSTATGTTGAAPSERGFQKVGGRKLQSVLQSGGDGYTDPGQGALQPPSAAYGAATNRESDLSGTSFYRDSGSHYGSTAGHNSQAYEIPGFETGPSAAAAVRSRNMQTLPSDSSMAGQGPSSNRESRVYDSPATGNPFADPNPRADRALATFSSSPDSESSGSLRSPTPGIDEALSYHQGPVRTPLITGGNNPPPPPAPRRPGQGPDGVGRSNPSWDGSRHSRFSEAI